MGLHARREQWPVRPIGAVLAVAGFACLLTACAGGFSGPEQAYKDLTRVDYGKPYIGMSKQQVIGCAGQPRSRIPAGSGGETFVYHYNGAGPVPGGTPKNAACTASLTFEGGTLVRVNYAHKDGRSPYAWQAEKDPAKAEKMKREVPPTCVFSLPRCQR